MRARSPTSASARNLSDGAKTILIHTLSGPVVALQAERARSFPIYRLNLYHSIRESVQDECKDGIVIGAKRLNMKAFCNNLLSEWSSTKHDCFATSSPPLHPGKIKGLWQTPETPDKSGTLGGIRTPDTRLRTAIQKRILGNRKEYRDILYSASGRHFD
jgi:hypothetical protein